MAVLPRRLLRLSPGRGRGGGRRRPRRSTGARVPRDLRHAGGWALLGSRSRGDRAQRATGGGLLGGPPGPHSPDRTHRLVPARVRSRRRRGGHLLLLLARPRAGPTFAPLPPAAGAPAGTGV